MKLKTMVIPTLFGAVSAAVIIKNRQTPQNLGLKGGQLTSLQMIPNGISSNTHNIHSKVEPFPYNEDKETSRNKMMEAINKQGNFEVEKDEDDYLHIVFKNNLGLKDDMELFFNEEEKKVDVRSVSRTLDIGQNRKRYENIKDHYMGIQSQN